MAEEQHFEERTEQASTRRREKAREEGQVARSQDMTGAFLLCVGVTTLLLIGPGMGAKLGELIRSTMANAPFLAKQVDQNFVGLFSNTAWQYFVIMAPIFGVIFVFAIVANIAQVGFQITPKALRVRWERLDVVKGFTKLFSIRSLVTLVRDMIKIAIIAFVAWRVLQGEQDQFFALADMSVGQMASQIGSLAAALALKIGAAFLAVALLDYVYQRWEHERSLKMSKQEVKEEHKETEGSPQVKSRIRQIQRAMLRQRMLSAVPKADVVITNPTHIAVALRYDQTEMTAPYVVAKGERLLAQRIKDIAREHNIPVIEDKPLARSLFKICEVGQMVPANLYRAVAEILAYVYKLKGSVVNRG